MCNYWILITGSYRWGGDYYKGPYTVRIPAGKTNISFSVTIRNDGDYESTNETFLLIIDPYTLPSHVTTGSLHTSTVSIVSDESKFTFLVFFHLVIMLWLDVWKCAMYVHKP